MNELKKELIALEIIKTLKGRFDNFPEDAENNRNAPFHEAFLKAFSVKIKKYVTSVPIFVSLSSWMHGLSTTLGQAFFENVAHIISDGEKKEFKQKQISENQQSIITDIIIRLSNGISKPNLTVENKLIFNLDNSKKIDSTNFVVDNYYEDSTSVVAIELKTVKPNKSIFKEEKTKILNAKAALKRQFPDKEIKYFIGFPFDPLNEAPTGGDKKRFLDYSINFTKYFDPEEVLLANELWNYLSGENNTMEEILNIINVIATPDFLDNYLFLNDAQNSITSAQKYIDLLTLWYLQRDKKIINNSTKVLENIKENKRLERIFHQSLFNDKGIYNNNRVNSLFDFL